MSSHPPRRDALACFCSGASCCVEVDGSAPPLSIEAAAARSSARSGGSVRARIASTSGAACSSGVPPRPALNAGCASASASRWAGRVGKSCRRGGRRYRQSKRGRQNSQDRHAAHRRAAPAARLPLRPGRVSRRTAPCRPWRSGRRAARPSWPGGGGRGACRRRRGGRAARRASRPWRGALAGASLRQLLLLQVVRPVPPT